MKCLLLSLLLMPAMASAVSANVVQPPAPSLGQVVAPGNAVPQAAVALPFGADVKGVASMAFVSEAQPQAASLPQWEIKAGASLRSTLDRWCERAGYRLVWNVDGGYRAQGDLTVEGDFAKAVMELFGAIRQDLHLHVDITKNKLVLVARGEK
ncbi:TcpQ domain-containing protein [Rugamonas aquatica]|nr:TcpQ domain-containing protein [Rugamonas aquatica]